MKLPKYVAVSYNGRNATFAIKKWGVPIITAKALLRQEIKPWYGWILAWLWIYPKCCIQTMFKKGE